MAPRRRPRAGAAAPKPPSLASLPDDLLLRCLQPLSQEARFRSVALVSKRFQQLCLAPLLLRSLTVDISGSNALPRSAALLQFLTAHAVHVQELELDVDPAADGDNEDALQLSDSQHQELAGNAAGVLVACAAGALRLLTVSDETPLISTAWLPALRHLQSLRLGSPTRALRLPAGVSRLTALAEATLCGSPLVLEGPLPPGLTWLTLEDRSSTELPRQVSQLSELATIHLASVKYQAASMACLSTLTTLRRLEVTRATALPATLPAMTWLECLSIGLADSTSAAEQAAWQQAEAASLPRLTRLTTLLLSIGSEHESTLTAIAQLPRLQRLWLWADVADPLPNPAALHGPWLASLRWVGLPWDCLESAAGLLRAAPRLEYVCSLDIPTRTDEARWLAAWDFLATHPPLRCFGVDEADGDIPSLPLLNALFRLHNRRLALQLSRPGDPGSSFSNFSCEVLESERIPPPIL